MVRISHLKHVSTPLSIVVRNYNNKSIIHFPQVTTNSVKLEDEIGQWKIKYKKLTPEELVPKEYSQTIEFDKL